MKKSIAKTILSKLFTPYRTLRRFNRLRTTEHFIIGYPRSGNTWTKFLLGSYLKELYALGEMPLFSDFDFWGRCLVIGNRHRIDKSHGDLNWSSLQEDQITYKKFIKPYEKKSVILLTRYPLDSLVSNWVFYRNISFKFQGELTEFLEHPLHSLTKWIKYHNLWAEAKQSTLNNIELLRYEDLRAKPKQEFIRMLDFLGIQVNLKKVEAALNYASIENMRRMQQSGNSPKNRRTGKAVIAVRDPKNPESRHVRRGIVGGYRDYLEPSVAKAYEARIALELSDWFGYSQPPEKKA